MRAGPFCRPAIKNDSGAILKAEPAIICESAHNFGRVVSTGGQFPIFGAVLPMKWRRGELNPCPRRYPRKHLHVYPAINSEEPSHAPAHCRLPSVHEIDSRTGAVAPPIRQPAVHVFAASRRSTRKRRGQLSRESETFVVCVYLFGPVFNEANEPSSTCRLRFQR